MKISTKYHGEIEVNQKDMFNFQHGLPGFLEERSFVLLPLEENSPFLILQSALTAELGFIIVNPFQFFTTYEFDLSENDKASLGLSSEQDVAVWTILNVKDPFENSTANLQAPIILNTKNNEAKQLILNDSRYQTKHRIFLEKIAK